MAVTVEDIQDLFNSHIGDSSTDRVTAAERLTYISQATVWFKEETSNDHSVSTYDIEYLDGVHYYKITTAIADLLESNDLRQKVGDNLQSFTPKSSREMAEDIAQQSYESAFAIERRDGDSFLVINHDSKYKAMQISTFSSLTADGDTWEVDATNSDATNLSVIETDYTEGGSAFNFDIDVSQSGNNKAVIFNDGFTSGDLTDDKDITSFLLDVKFPEVTNITSVTFYWGSSTSNYYSVTETTDLNGNAFITDWQTFKFDWLGASVTGTPDDSAITYFQVDINYGAGQTDATSFKIDNLRIVRPETLKFYYTDWKLGTDASLNDLTVYAATTDIPYYSGQYDQYIYPIAHYASMLCFQDLRLGAEADRQELKAIQSVQRIKDIVPSSVVKERKNFKVQGVRFNRGGRRRFQVR